MQDQVIKWLKEQGYPLEMRVASALRDTGLWVRQSTHYTDPESNKSREIDVLASENEPYGIGEIHFVIECKVSNKPWVLFTSPFTLVNFNSLSAFAIFSRAALNTMVDRLFSRDLANLEWAKKKGRIGYNLTPAFTTGEDAAYQAAYSVIKASLSLLHEPINQIYSKFIVVFPIVVIGNPLFECFVGENGEINVSQIQEGWLFFNARIQNFQGTCIRIVSESGLEQLSSEILDVKNHLQKLLAPDIERESKKLRERLNLTDSPKEPVQSKL